METKKKIPSQNSIHEEFSNSASNTRCTCALYVHILHIHYIYIVFTTRDVLASTRECVRRIYNEIFYLTIYTRRKTGRREWWAAKVIYVYLRSEYILHYIYIYMYIHMFASVNRTRVWVFAHLYRSNARVSLSYVRVKPLKVVFSCSSFTKWYIIYIYII